MKILQNTYSRLALIFCITLTTGYAMVYAWTNFTLSDAASGKPLTSAMMQSIMNNINELNARLESAEAMITNLSASWAVIAFNRTSCPTGWSPADGGSGRPDLRGEFIRGWDSGRNVDVGRTLGTWQVDNVKNQGFYEGWAYGINKAVQEGLLAKDNRYSSVAIGSNGNETRPRNVALLYCVKN